MKPSFPRAAAFAAVFAAVVTLSACGGGGGDSGGSNAVANNPAALTKTDSAIGTGTEATNGARVQVNYTGWLYNASATDFKGKQFDAGTITFIVGGGSLITGFDQGVIGMKVGGTRTLLIPSAQGYGSTGTTGIPANSGLVFEIKATAVL